MHKTEHKKEWRSKLNRRAWDVLVIVPPLVLGFFWDRFVQVGINPLEILSKMTVATATLGVIAYNLKTRSIDFMLKMDQSYEETFEQVAMVKRICAMCGELMLLFLVITVLYTFVGFLDPRIPMAGILGALGLLLFEGFEALVLCDHLIKAKKKEPNLAPRGMEVDPKYRIS